MSSSISGFSKKDSKRIESHLNCLVPHLSRNKFALVGGIAIRYFLENSGYNLPQKSFNDIDIVVDNLSVVHPEIIKDFLTYHVHSDGQIFFFAFVDPISKTKVDIFDSTFPVLDKIPVKIGDNIIDLISPENQLVTLIPTILLASNKLKRDPKLLEEVKLLTSIADMRKAQEIWEKMGQEGSIEDGIRKVEIFRKKNPQFFQEKPYRKSGPYNCSYCIKLKEFPIVPMKQIYDILGYVE